MPPMPPLSRGNGGFSSQAFRLPVPPKWADHTGNGTICEALIAPPWRSMIPAAMRSSNSPVAALADVDVSAPFQLDDRDTSIVCEEITAGASRAIAPTISKLQSFLQFIPGCF